jgi:hypothetical protein
LHSSELAFFQFSRQDKVVISACAKTRGGGRVARWYIFKPKIQIWVIFWRLDLEKIGIFLVIWNILRTFGTYIFGLWEI